MGGLDDVTTMLAVPGEPLRVVRSLGGGATSRVFLAERGGSLVVAKVGRDVGQRLRFADEAERLCLVDSPWVARLLDVAWLTQDVTVSSDRLPRGAPVLLFAWEEGETLARVAEGRAPEERRALALTVARDIGAALSDLHAVGSAHGDIKPQNIVLTATGARLIDFGLSGDASVESASGGTKRYLAPEVLRGEATGDARRRDVYALGVVLSELIEAQAAPADALSDVARALLQQAPGARPSAAWIGKRLGVAPPPGGGEKAVYRA
jgi:serine/threonine-protein kinase PknK